MPAKKSTVKKPAAKKTSSLAPAETVSSSAAKSLKTPLSPRFLTIALVIIGIALLVYKFGPYFVPAMVGNRPVTRFEIWNRLEKSYGTQTHDDIVNEYILEAAIAKAGVTVDQSRIDAQMGELETQFESLGGLDEALAQRGLTREELEKQVKTQLAVEQILESQANPTDEEAKAYYDENADTLYADQAYEDIKDEVRVAVRDGKLRDAFLEWFAKAKEEVAVKNFGL